MARVSGNLIVATIALLLVGGVGALSYALLGQPDDDDAQYLALWRAADQASAARDYTLADEKYTASEEGALRVSKNTLLPQMFLEHAQTKMALGRLSEAEKLLRRAFAASQQLAKQEPSYWSAAKQNEIRINENLAAVLAKENKFSEADQLYRSLLKSKDEWPEVGERARVALGHEQFLHRLDSEKPVRAQIDNAAVVRAAELFKSKGEAAAAKEQFQQAQEYYQQALALCEKSGNNDSQIDQLLSLLHIAYIGTHKYDEAIACLQRLIERGTTHKTTISAQTLALINTEIGTTYSVKGFYLGGDAYAANKKEAVKYFFKAIPVLTKSDPSSFNICMVNLAEALQQLGRFDEQRSILDQIRVADSLAHGNQSIEVADAYVQLAQCDREQQNWSVAHHDLATGTDLARRVTISDDKVLLTVADAVRLLGDSSSARPLYQKLLTLRENKYGRESVDAADAILRISLIDEQEGNFSSVKEACDKAAQMYAQHKAKYGPHSADSLCQMLATGYASANDNRAVSFAREALVNAEAARNMSSIVMNTILLASMLETFAQDEPSIYAEGHRAEAEALRRQLLVRTEKELGTSDAWYGVALSLAANTDAQAHKDAKATAEFTKSEEILKNSVGALAYSLAGVLRMQAHHYIALRDWKAAQRCLRGSLEIMRNVHSPQQMYFDASKIVSVLDADGNAHEAAVAFKQAQEYWALAGGNIDSASLNAMLAMDPMETVGSLVYAGDHFRAINNLKEAEKTYELALALRTKHFKSRESLTCNVSRNLLSALEQTYTLEGKRILARQAHDRLVQISP